MEGNLAVPLGDFRLRYSHLSGPPSGWAGVAARVETQAEKSRNSIKVGLQKGMSDIQARRSQAAAQKLMGDFAGVLHSDRWSGYNGLSCFTLNIMLHFR